MANPDFRYCRRCRKLFQYRGNIHCPNCLQEMDRQFTEVRDYMYDHPSASIDDICENVDVEQADVLNWLREGRLILNIENASILACESCGQGIKTGKYCNNCADRVSKELNQMSSDLRRSIAPRNGQRMYSQD